MPYHTDSSLSTELTSRVPQLKGDKEGIYPELAFVIAKMSVLGLILSTFPYLRSMEARFPL